MIESSSNAALSAAMFEMEAEPVACIRVLEESGSVFEKDRFHQQAKPESIKKIIKNHHVKLPMRIRPQLAWRSILAHLLRHFLLQLGLTPSILVAHSNFSIDCQTMNMTRLQRSILIIIVTLSLLAGGALLWVQYMLQPIDATAPKQTFSVDRGASSKSIAADLEAAGLVRSGLVFRVYARLMDLDSSLQAGSYELSPAQSLSEIARVLTSARDESVRITLLEGWRREEIAEYLDAQNLEAFDAADFVDKTATLEGRLFPDTYFVDPQSDTDQIISLLTTTFDQKVLQPLASEFADSQLSESEAITLASIVEREARGFEDRRHVAGILLNRLEIGMALQADATMQYARGYDRSAESWWSPPLPAHRQIVSPYNTYQQPGLPPGPIANPSVSAIRAVLDPNPSDDLFYIHTSSGAVYYAKTLEEHNANINRYLR